MTALITAHRLRKRYKNTQALDEVSFTVAPGRIVGLIGPNGAGKTSLLKALLGLTPFEGDLEVMGHDPRQHRQRLMTDVCFIADVAVLPRWLRVKDAVDFVEGVHPKFNRAKCDTFLARTKLKPEQKVKQLSKGMVVQLHLALIMAIDARLLILDEPTLGLDVLYRKQFYQSLLEDYFDAERTIIVATHQVEEVEHLLTDVMFLRDGRLVLNEAMETLATRYSEVVVPPAQLAAARALGPIDERPLLGQHWCLFDRVPPDQLARFGEVRRPSLSDVFVAIMKGTYA